VSWRRRCASTGVRLSGHDGLAAVTSPLAYLYRMGSNLMFDRLRGERRAAHRDWAWWDSKTVRAGPDAISSEPAADAVVDARQRLTRLSSLLRELKPQTQRVFRMHKFEGLPHAEVAARLGVSRSSIEKHMIEALKHLSVGMQVCV
jgi:RNA polymerase sigma factor (sigma-70 family)